MSNWQKVALTEIYDISSGLSKSADSFGSGYPFLSFKDVFGNYFLPDELEQLVESTDKERERGSIRRGDVFLTRTSETMHELGMSSIALKDYPGATFNGFTKRLRPKENSSYEVHPEFIGYCLRSPSFRAGMLAFSTMSTRASLNNDMISRLVIQLPLIEVQKGIAKVLKSFDDKIQLNRQINQTLEAMAQAIFQSWFVDFDPVKAKITAREQWQTLIDGERSEWLNDILSKQAYLKTCLSELTANGEQSASETLYLNIAAMTAISSRDETSLADMSADEFSQLYKTASLFPERLVESEIGEIPEGWEVDKLGERIDVLNGFAFKSGDYTSDGTFVLRTKNFNSECLIDRLHDDVFLPESFLISHEKYLCEPFDYHLIMVGASVGNRGMIFPFHLPALRNQNMWCFRPKNSMETGKVYTKYLLDYVVDKTKGLASGSAREFFRKGDFQNINIVFGTVEVNNYYERLIMSFLQLQSETYSSTENLKCIRDSLLPKLLSGELDVSSLTELADIEPAAMDV
jgi:type I restriction enzyme S subunit|tara:strand:+ start:9109 stop:10662 length:1554 start_codon:yes stop_codon:yes gene_type:complete